MKLYEGLFLIDAGRAAKAWDETETEIVSVLEKHGSQMKQSSRFDERKLAFPVKKVRRGAYLLTYFEADPQAIDEIREDLGLSEAILRSFILRVGTDEVPETPTLGTAGAMDTTETESDEDSSAPDEDTAEGEEPEVEDEEEKE